jgi:ribonuclease HII
MAMASIIRNLKPDIAYIDACDVIEKRCSEQILRVLPWDLKIVCEHMADSTYPIVSAASILAKVRRDKLIEDLHAVYGDFNSGYCHDKKTIRWLKDYFKNHEEVPHFIRGSWVTIRRIKDTGQ